MGIGKTLLDILQEKGENPNSLAEKVGVSPSTIYSITKRDNMKVDISLLARICKVLNVSMDRFYDEYISEQAEKKQDILSDKDNLIIKKYNELDIYGKKAVQSLLDIEYERCISDRFKTKIQIAARNGEFETLELTDSEKQKILDEINQMPDVED